jgi:hypothetical protein
LKARFITLLGLIAAVAGALDPYLDMLPQSWRTPIMVVGVIATTCGPALFGPRGFTARRRKKLSYEDVFPHRSDHPAQTGSGRK